MTHKEYADSLRLLADLFEQHTEIALPHDAEMFEYFAASSKQEMATLARALGKSTKEVTDSFFKLHSSVGSIEFIAYSYRESICTRREVGKVQTPAIPEVVIPARPAGEITVYEWHCPDSLFE